MILQSEPLGFDVARTKKPYSGRKIGPCSRSETRNEKLPDLVHTVRIVRATSSGCGGIRPHTPPMGTAHVQRAQPHTAAGVSPLRAERQAVVAVMDRAGVAVKRPNVAQYPVVGFNAAVIFSAAVASSNPHSISISICFHVSGTIA